MSSRAPALLTDLYQLTMAHSYFELGMRDTAVFELLVRRLPQGREFLIHAGLEQVIEYLEGLRFSGEEIAFLSGTRLFSDRFLTYLAELRFTGSVHAMAEGTPFFENEPVLRITAPIIEAQLVESRLLNLVHLQSLVASKAARCVFAARGRKLVDFGMRRAHGAEAALLGARAAFIAGFDATATVEAGWRFGIPLSGTMAHSFIQAHANEEEAFRNFLRTRPGGTTLLIDTYDTRRAAQRLAPLIRSAEASQWPGHVQAVRIDSGDLASEARAVRSILNEAGLQHIQIVVSGGLDEHQIEKLVAENAPVDAFGVGTSLLVSNDHPSLDMAYKLQEYGGHARRKRSASKATLPGRKQVFRERDSKGRLRGDCIALEDESVSGEPLLAEVMRAGRRIVELPSLTRIRDRCRRELERLPSERPYPVRVSHRVEALAAQFDAAHE